MGAMAAVRQKMANIGLGSVMGMTDSGVGDSGIMNLNIKTGDGMKPVK